MSPWPTSSSAVPELMYCMMREEGVTYDLDSATSEELGFVWRYMAYITGTPIEEMAPVPDDDSENGRIIVVGWKQMWLWHWHQGRVWERMGRF